MHQKNTLNHVLHSSVIYSILGVLNHITAVICFHFWFGMCAAGHPEVPPHLSCSYLPQNEDKHAQKISFKLIMSIFFTTSFLQSVSRPMPSVDQGR